MHKRIQLPINNENEILYISETIIDNSFKPVQHSHPNLEIIFFIEGRGEVITNTKKYIVKKNDILIINSHIKHYEVSSKNLKFYALGLNHLKFVLENIYEDIIIYSLNDSSALKILNLYDLLFLEANEKNINYLNIMNFLFNTIQIIIKRNININFKKDFINNQTSIINSIKQHIENYYYDPINIKNLASLHSVSISYLCHKFKEETGYSIIEYKIKNQIEEAKNLLTISDMSIIEISDSVGFTSSSYFNKVFKKMTKLTPKEYRKINKNL